MRKVILGGSRRAGRFLALPALLAALAIGWTGASSAAEKEDGHPYIGIYMQELTDEIAKAMDIDVHQGVLVADVVEGGPADEAGLREGDVIIEFDGKRVEKPKELRRMVLETEVGDKVKVEVLRGKDKKTLTIVVGEEPYEAESEFVLELPEGVPKLAREFVSFFNPTKRLGVKVERMNEDLASYFGVESGEGVLVLDVEEESAAAEAGIRSGDVILEFDGEKIDSVEELREALRDLDEGEEFRVEVVRHGKKLELSGKLEESEPMRWRFKRRCFDYPVYGPPRTGMEKLREELKELEKRLEKLERKMEKHGED